MSVQAFATARPPKPYPGLRPFEAEEWSIFFGRERMIDEVIERLAERRLVLIHGASGSGKSSLVRAGVLPKLARQYQRHGAVWLTCAMRPSGGPLWNLAAEFARLEGRAEDDARIGALAARFNARDATLASVAGQVEGLAGKSLCILVDQFEELFRFEKETNREEAELFVDLIGRVAKDAAPPPGGVDVRVIITMRSEFLGDCARFDRLAETINQTQYLVPRMDDDAMLRAVRRPGMMFGANVDEGLAKRLIGPVRGREDELPLLQHGLMLMWEDALAKAPPGGRPTLDLAVVDAAGGLAGLLSGHAEKVMESVARDAEGRRIVENLFRELTDVNADGSAIRRPRPLADLAAAVAAPAEKLLPILDAFRAADVSFITPYAPAPIGARTRVDISHEALIRCWRRIAGIDDGWLKREFEDGLAWRSLHGEARAFGRDPERVLSAGATLDRSRLYADRNEAWSARYGGGWTEAGKLLAASRAAAAWVRKRTIMTMAALGVLALGSLGLAGWAYQASQEQKVLTALAQAATESAQRATEGAQDAQRDAQTQLKVAENQTALATGLLEQVTQQGRHCPTGVTLDAAMADRMRTASGRGNPAAQYLLGVIYSCSDSMADRDTLAKEAFEKAAAAGEPRAMEKLGEFAADAKPPDYSAARAWYEKAAAAGDAWATTNLGALYEDGKGVPRDFAKARGYYEAAAAKGDGRAMKDIGVLEEAGNGGPADPAKALEWYKRAADAGDEIGMRLAGVLYYRGRGVEQDYVQARLFYTRAANAGDAEAMQRLAYIYDKGLGVPKAYSIARDWYEKAALLGDAIAMNNLGTMYDDGKGLTQDYELARKWYEKSADAGDERAMDNLGGLYELGHGVAVDHVQAAKWYERSALAGDENGMHDLARMYDEGLGVAKDVALARDWYEKGAKAGNRLSMNMLGSIYDDGRGVPQDFAKARDWYQKAADAGSARAMRNLGQLEENGKGGPVDLAKARALYERAAADGDDLAMVDLGRFYDAGLGVTQDFQLARHWFEMAADKDNSDAMERLAFLYANGEGVLVNYGKARELYEKAAALGNQSAMNNIGALYEDGNGVDPDLVKAREWYEKAAAAGNGRAMKNIGFFYQFGRGVEVDFKLAFAWYKRSAEADDDEGMRLLADLYAGGKGVEADLGKAREWYERAAAKDNAQAMHALGDMYATGHGVAVDFDAAREWFEKAAHKGDKKAERELLNWAFEADLRAAIAAEDAKAYGQALELRLKLEAEISADETRTKGQPGNRTAEAASGVAWDAIFLKKFELALDAAERSNELAPRGALWIQENHAHALMFAGHLREARTLYFSHYDERLFDTGDDTTWRQGVIADFEAFRQAGLTSPLMQEVESKLR